MQPGHHNVFTSKTPTINNIFANQANKTPNLTQNIGNKPFTSATNSNNPFGPPSMPQTTISAAELFNQNKAKKEGKYQQNLPSNNLTANTSNGNFNNSINQTQKNISVVSMVTTNNNQKQTATNIPSFPNQSHSTNIFDTNVNNKQYEHLEQQISEFPYIRDFFNSSCTDGYGLNS